MAADLRWVASLVDAVSAPAKKMTSSLRGFEGATQRADQALATMSGGRVAKVGDALVKGIGGGAKLAAGAVAGFAVAAVASFAAAGAAVAAFGVHHAVAAENAHLALGAVIGDAGETKKALDGVKALSNFWGTDPRKIEEQLTKLVSKGHSVADAMKIIQGAADLGAMGNDANKLIEAFGEIDAKGKLSSEAIAAIAKSGVDPGKFRAALGGALGIDSGNLAADIEKAFAAGTVDAATLQAAALNTITGMTGKALGGLAEKQGHTIGGLLDNLKSVPERLFDAANTSGALEPLRKALEALTGALNPESATGKKLVDAIGKIAGSVGRVITTITGDGANVGDWIDAITAGIEIAADVIDAMAEMVSGFVTEFLVGFKSISGPMGKFGGDGLSMKKIVSALVSGFKFLGAVVGVTAGLIVQVVSWIVEAVGWVVDAWNGLEQSLSKANLTNYFMDLYGEIAGTFDDLLEYFDDLWDTLVGIGGDIVDGIWEGIKGAWGDLKKGWNGLVDTLPASVADKLKINSPSKVMEDFGGWTVEGFLGPVENSIGRAEDAGFGLAGATAKGAGSASVSSGRGGPVQIIVNVNGAGAGGEELGDIIADRIVRAFADVGLELGAA